MYLHRFFSTSPPLFRLCIEESSILGIARFLQTHANEQILRTDEHDLL